MENNEFIEHIKALYKIELTPEDEARLLKFMSDSDIDKCKCVFRPVSDIEAFIVNASLYNMITRHESIHIEEIVFMLKPFVPRVYTEYDNVRRAEKSVTTSASALNPDEQNIAIIRHSYYIYIYNPNIKVVGGIIFEDI